MNNHNPVFPIRSTVPRYLYQGGKGKKGKWEWLWAQLRQLQPGQSFDSSDLGFALPIKQLLSLQQSLCKLRKKDPLVWGNIKLAKNPDVEPEEPGLVFFVGAHILPGDASSIASVRKHFTDDSEVFIGDRDETVEASIVKERTAREIAESLFS